MKIETNTMVINPGEITSSTEVEREYDHLCKEAKERHAICNFGTIGFSSYCEWVLKNLLPLA